LVFLTTTYQLYSIKFVHAKRSGSSTFTYANAEKIIGTTLPSSAVVTVASFNQTAFAVMTYDNYTTAAMRTSYAKVILCSNDESCTQYAVNVACSNTPSFIPLQSSPTSVNFLLYCGSYSPTIYTFSKTVSYQQTGSNAVYLSPDYNYQLTKINNNTLIAHAVKDGSLYARVIRVTFPSYYYSTTVLTSDILNLISTDAVSTEAVQVNSVDAQVFFTYNSTKTNKYVTVAAGIVGKTSKVLDVDDATDLESLSGYNSAPLITTMNTTTANKLFYLFPRTSTKSYAATMTLVIRGNVRPIGVTTETSYSWSSSQIHFSGYFNLYYSSTFYEGMRYFAKRNGDITTERKSSSGNNYPVGIYLPFNRFQVDIQ